MADTGIFNNSIAWAHYRVKGGRKILWLPTLGYGTLMGMLIIGSLRLDPDDAEDILRTWMIPLLLLQAGALLLFGGSAVRNAIRKDTTTGMIASHRLMPISGTEAIVGYIMGAVPQPLAVFVTTLLIGILVSGPAKLSAFDWMIANGLLLLFAACSWVAAVAISLLAPKSAGALVFLFIIMLASGGTLLLALPALAVICTPIIGPTAYGIMMKGAGDLSLYYVPILCQLCVTILFFIVAVRKFHRDDLLSAGPLFGLLIVTVFVAISAYGIANWSTIRPGPLWMGGSMSSVQIITSMIVASMLGLIPISAAAWLNEQYLRRRSINDTALGRRPGEAILIVLAVAAIIAVLPVLSANTTKYRHVALMFLPFAAGLAPIAAIMRLRYRTKGTALVPTILWFALAWIGPWLAAAGMMAFSGAEKSQEVAAAWSQASTIACFSPIAVVIAIWDQTSMYYWPGLIGQIILAAAMTILLYTRPAPREMIFPVNGSQS